MRGERGRGSRGCGRRLGTTFDESGTALLGFRLGGTSQQFDLHHGRLLLLLLLLLDVRIRRFLQRSLQMGTSDSRAVVMLLMLLLLGIRVQRRMVAMVVVVVELLLLLLLQIIVMLRP